MEQFVSVSESRDGKFLPPVFPDLSGLGFRPALLGPTLHGNTPVLLSFHVSIFLAEQNSSGGVLFRLILPRYELMMSLDRLAPHNNRPFTP